MYPKKYLQALIFSTLFLFSHQSFSQQPLEDFIAAELSLEALYALPYIDIATGYAVPLEKAPSVATIITADDIKAMGALTLDEVLESVPGFHVMYSGLSSSVDIYSIRGMYTNRGPQTLMLLNGHRISSDVAAGIFPDTAKINVQNISRIEIVRGPGSAVYGADAFSGVINIITKNARELDGFHIGVKGGSFDTKNIWLQYGGEIKNGWKVAVNFEHTEQGADTSRKIEHDLQSTFDDLFVTNASLAPSYMDRRYETSTYNIHLDNGSWKIGLDGWRQRDLGTGTGLAHAIDHDGSVNVDQVLFSLEYQSKNWHEDFELSSSFTYEYVDQQYHLNLFPPNTVVLIGDDGNLFTSPFNPVSFPDGVIGNPHMTSKTAKLDFTSIYLGMDYHTWRLNFGIFEEQLEAEDKKNFGLGVIDGSEGAVNGTLTDVAGPYTHLPNKDRLVKYISLQDVWDIAPDWILTAGVRYDHYSDVGGTINPRAALVWTITDSFITKFLYGRAFRAPSFSELYNRNNPVTLGNSSLDPETIDTFEIVFSYELIHDLNMDFNLYHYQADDMIDFIDNGDNSGSTAQNQYSLKGTGFEFALDWKINQAWQIKGNYSYQKTVDGDTNQQMPFIPKQQAYLDVRWAFHTNWMAASQLHWVSERKRADADSRDKIDDYTLVNLTVRRTQLTKHWDLSASVKNLFDEDAKEPSEGSIPSDYPLNERSAFIELHYHY